MYQTYFIDRYHLMKDTMYSDALYTTSQIKLNLIINQMEKRTKLFIFYCLLFVVDLVLIALKFAGAITWQWKVILSLTLLPTLYVVILVAIGYYTAKKRSQFKTANGTLFKVMDVVKDTEGPLPNEYGFLVNYNGYWMVEYFDTTYRISDINNLVKRGC